MFQEQLPDNQQALLEVVPQAAVAVADLAAEVQQLAEVQPVEQVLVVAVVPPADLPEAA